MRASILVLGPMLARDGHAVVSLPGGCAIGARPVDLHLRGLEALGAELDLRDGYVHATAPERAAGARSSSSRCVSVGATENVLMAATLARGTTVLKNAAREPEIVDLAQCLRRMGARDRRRGHRHHRDPGRRPAARRHPPGGRRPHRARHLHARPGDRRRRGRAGRRPPRARRRLRRQARGGRASRSAPPTPASRSAAQNGHIRAVDVTTAPFPGFPTDLQAQMMALLDARRRRQPPRGAHLREPLHARARAHPHGRADRGARRHRHRHRRRASCRGAPVMATDLRASVSLILAGLAAEGETRVARVYHLDRGYERVEEKLSACGAAHRAHRTSGPHDRGRALRGRRRAAAAPARRDAPRISTVISALLQDAVAQTSEIAWAPRHRRFTLLVNRFRWEDAPAAERQGRPFERVRAVLADRERARRPAPAASTRSDRDLVLSLLAARLRAGRGRRRHAAADPRRRRRDRARRRGASTSRCRRDPALRRAVGQAPVAPGIGRASRQAIGAGRTPPPVAELPCSAIAPVAGRKAAAALRYAASRPGQRHRRSRQDRGAASRRGGHLKVRDEQPDALRTAGSDERARILRTPRPADDRPVTVHLRGTRASDRVHGCRRHPRASLRRWAAGGARRLRPAGERLSLAAGGRPRCRSSSTRATRTSSARFAALLGAEARGRRRRRRRGRGDPRRRRGARRRGGDRADRALGPRCG